MKFSIIIFLLSLKTLAFGQSVSQSELIGSWELLKEERTPEIKGSPNGPQNKKRELFLKFDTDGRVSIKDGGLTYKVDFSVFGGILKLGVTKFTIQKVSSTELILQEGDEFSTTTYFYKRAQVDIETVKDQREIIEKYPNGQIMRQGFLVDGFKNGIWLEWFETGEIKRVTHYNLEVVFMDIEFDNQGIVKSKRYYDLKSKGFKNE